LDSRDDIILINVAYSLLTIIQCRYRLFSITHLLLSPMLTKEDLQAIERLFENSFDKKFGAAFDESFDKKFGPAFDKSFGPAFDKAFGPAFDKSFDKAFGPAFDTSFGKEFGPAFDKKSKTIYSKLNKLQKDIDTVVRVFDSDIVDLKDRAEKLEAAVFI